MNHNQTITYDEYILKFKDLIKSLGLNNSIQREYVLKVLFDSEEHLSADEILFKVREEHKVSIGITTVYKMLNFLEEIKVLSSISLEGSNVKVYELSFSTHHDHLVCLKCGKIVEFMHAKIEAFQDDIAKENGFTLESHSMILYGTCSKCKNVADK